MLRNKKVLVFVLTAVFLRLFLSVFQYSGDIKNHLVWGNSFLEGGIGFYSRHFPGFNDANYPPLAIMLFSLSNLLYQNTLNFFTYLNTQVALFPSAIIPFFSSENVRYAFLKLPGIASDIFLGLLVYKIIFFQNKKYAFSALLLILFNPAIIYISSVWGQIESITLVLLVWSIFIGLYAKTDNRKQLSIPVFILACLSKQTALWFAPFFLVFWLKTLPISKITTGSILSTILFFILYLPFGLLPVQAVLSYFSTLSGSSDLVSDAAWNIWYFIFPGRVSDSLTVLGISIRNLSIFLLLTSLTIIIVGLYKKYSTKRLLNSLFVWSLLVFFLQTRVHERHLAPAIIFCILSPIVYSRLFIDYLILSVFHFFNLYWSLRLPFI